MSTIRLTLALLLPVFLLALLPPAAGADLFLIDQAVSPRPPDRGGPEIWDRFWVEGKEYAIISDTEKGAKLLSRMGAGVRPLPVADGEGLFIVTAFAGMDPAALSRRTRTVIADGHTALVIADQGQADSQAEKGLEIRAVLPPPPSIPRARPSLVERGWDGRIQEIIDAVTGTDVWEMLGNLSGESGVTIEGSPYTIQTRNSYQAVPIEKATQYCYEYFQELGLESAFHAYTWNGYNWRNVVAEQPGSVHPENLCIICGHLDDLPEAAVAPGADDNASGSTAVLLAAAILNGREFENTIRYVLFTGEEQGLRGSYYYVQDLAAAGEIVLGALNFDMTAYDGNADNLIEVHCGTLPASEMIGDLFIATNSDYGLGLSPEKITSGSTGASDHARFWNAGYPAILGIEDTWVGATNDFNPNYHTAADNRANCNGPYATAYTKAAVGTIARLAVLLPSPPPPTPPPTPGRLVLDGDDFDGDGTADLGLWRAADGSWRIRDVSTVYYGLNGDIPVTGDYNADGIAEIAQFRPSSGQWFLRNPQGGSLWRATYGMNGDIPVPADYNGDFRSDTAVFRPDGGGWYVRGVTRFSYGRAGDLPVPGDYNGDGKAEPSVYRHIYGATSTAAIWYVRNLTLTYYGLAGDIPAAGDYSGDGTTQLSVFRASSGRWYVRGEGYVTFGQSGDIPVVFDSDGDGSADRALYRPSDGRWYIYGATSVAYGLSGDQPAGGSTY